MTTATLLKVNISLGLANSFKGSVHYHHGRKHSSIQAGTVLEELRVLHLDHRLQETVSHSGQSLSIYDIITHPHSDTLPPTRPHLLQQGYSSSIQADESMVAIPIKSPHPACEREQWRKGRKKSTV